MAGYIFCPHINTTSYKNKIRALKIAGQFCRIQSGGIQTRTHFFHIAIGTAMRTFTLNRIPCVCHKFIHIAFTLLNHDISLLVIILVGKPAGSTYWLLVSTDYFSNSSHNPLNLLFIIFSFVSPPLVPLACSI